MESKENTRIFGYDAAAYAQRDEGFSPDIVYDAGWNIVGSSLEQINTR